MTITYLAGPITGIKDYYNRFALAELALINKGHKVFNPAPMPPGLPHEAYMPICFAMIDACNTICFLPGWRDSKGAQMEYEYAAAKGLTMIFEEEIQHEVERLCNCGLAEIYGHERKLTEHTGADTVSGIAN